MPATATAPAPAAPANGGSTEPVAQALVPFTRAAKPHTEFIYDFGAQSPGTELPPIDIPAYGFLRAIHLRVDIVGSNTDADVEANEDAPWNAIASALIQDVNSTPIVGPMDGYSLYLADKWGGNRTNFDPRLSPTFSAITEGTGATAGSGSFDLRLSVEQIARTALGSLANANSSTTYKLRLTLGTLAQIYNTAPNNAGATIRVRVYLEAWSVPSATNWRGQPQEQLPPGNGTTGYLSHTLFTDIAVGQNTVRLPRVGNYIRQLIFIFRTSAADGRTAYETAGMPDPFSIYVDTRLWYSLSPSLQRRLMAEQLGIITPTLEGAGGLDNAVYVIGGNYDATGKVGNETMDLWLATLQSTRLELQFVSASSGTLEVITNDVAPPAAANLAAG